MQTISNLSVQQPTHHLSTSPAPQAAETVSLNAHPHADSTSESPSALPGTLKQPMADRQNWQNLLDAINLVAGSLKDYDTAPYVLSVLKLTQMAIHPDSSHHKTMNMGSKVTQSLEAFLTANGLPMPTSKAEFLHLKQEAAVRIAASPFGNLGGGLSWPVPLDQSQQQQLRLLAMSHAHHLGDKPLVAQTKSVLDFLAYQNPVPVAALNDPAKTLEFLLRSPQAQLMGKALERGLNGIATQNSQNDYLLAAISGQMDPESVQTPQRNTLAGFDVASSEHWGKPASAIVNGLGAHLSNTRKTSPEMARTGAYVLLARAAPEFLIKDIPASVTYGSPAWVNLSVAARSIEAQSPGSVPNMSFAQVMLKAESAALAEPTVTQNAQRGAMIDWAVVNGVIGKRPDDDYNPSELEETRTELNRQLSERATASSLLDTEIPTRKAIALAKLKERFGDNVPFEEKRLRVTGTRQQQFGNPLYDPNRAPAGLHSMLDIAMSGLSNYTWESTDSRINQALEGKSLVFDVNEVFKTQFEQSIESLNKGVNTTVKHLISNLPLEDRKNIEQGKITFFQPSFYRTGPNAVTSLFKPVKNELLVQAEHNGTHTYKIDIKNGSIKKVNPADVSALTWDIALKENKIKEFRAPGFSEAAQSAKTDTHPLPPNSFASPRTHYIADTFAKNLDLDNEDAVKQARGATTYDRQMATERAVTDFFLDLIPFKSSITNFINGNYLDGAIDLGMDILGFVTLGSTKAVQTGVKTLSAGAKALNVAKKIGVVAIGGLNPLSGLGDLAQGGAGLIGKGGKFLLEKGAQGFNTFKGATHSYDVLKAVSKGYDAAATGTLKLADHTVESAAVLKEGKWYAFDANRQLPYGPPLETFVPDIRAMDGKTLNLSLTDWVYNKLAGEIPVPPTSSFLQRYVPEDFKATLGRAKQPNNVVDFELGYTTGKPGDIMGYDPALSIPELQSLASQRFLSYKEVGTLARQIEQKKVTLSQEGFGLFKQDINAAGGTVTPMPQEYYLSQVNLASEGECAGMANALGLAIESGSENIFLGNLFTAAAKTKAANGSQFINDLSIFHNKVSGNVTFHMGKPVRQVPYQTIIFELTAATPGKTLRIATQDHALLAGVALRDNKPVWFYFDPNFGLAKFDSAKAMSAGLERTLNRGVSPFQHRAHGTTPGAPEYRISEFSGSDLAVYPQSSNVSRMVSVEL